MARKRDSEPDLEGLFKALGIKPKDTAIYHQALTHRSTLNESKVPLVSNERLEFLGDSVLGHAVSEYLFRENPNLSEGQLARRKSALVSEASVASWSKGLGLGDFLILGKGEEQSGGRDKVALLADAFEAVLGAIYSDLGWEKAKHFVLSAMEAYPLSKKLEKSQDAKSRLQEYTQRLYKAPPQYRLLKSQGPDHAKTFEIEVVVGGKSIAGGKGKTKKEAEQAGATEALEVLEKA